MPLFLPFCPLALISHNFLPSNIALALAINRASAGAKLFGKTLCEIRARAKGQKGKGQKGKRAKGQKGKRAKGQGQIRNVNHSGKLGKVLLSEIRRL